MLAKFIVLVLSLLTVNVVQAAYFKISVSAQTAGLISSSDRTHVIFSSRGNELYELPRMAAMSKADKIIEVYPQDQVLLYLPADQEQDHIVKSHSFNGRAVKIEFVNSLLSTHRLILELVHFSKIASFHFYGHSAITEGLFMDGQDDKDLRWYPGDIQANRLKGHFTDDAIATLNGCNSGHYLAPKLSKVWNLPVAGSLTGTHFEALYDDGRYYIEDFKTHKAWASFRSGPNQSRISCSSGCIRMRPDNGDYHGHYGIYQQGLPFYKFFCIGLSEEKCLAGMARSLLTDVSTGNLTEKSDMNDFASVAREWLCPSADFPRAAQSNCIQQLEALPYDEKVDLNPTQKLFTPYFGHSMQCDFSSCYSQSACMSNSNMNYNCALAQDALSSKSQTSTFVQEYLNFLKGIKYLQTAVLRTEFVPPVKKIDTGL